jgi:hypothetical protein
MEGEGIRALLRANSTGSRGSGLRRLFSWLKSKWGVFDAGQNGSWLVSVSGRRSHHLLDKICHEVRLWEALRSIVINTIMERVCWRCRSYELVVASMRGGLRLRFHDVINHIFHLGASGK